MRFTDSSDELVNPARKSPQGWWTKRKLIIGGMVLGVVVLAVALGAGLGVGLTCRPAPATSTPSTTPNNNGTYSNGVWKPVAGTTWNYQLSTPPTTTSTNGLQVWGIDLFDTPVNIISGLQTNGAKVICYFSAGSYENWRPDAGNFTAAVLGNNLDGWAGERWLDVTSPNVRDIMAARMDLAVQKGCNGVDPDNVDGYEQNTGFQLTQADLINYLKYLANQAHGRNLSIGLKNGGDIIPSVINFMEWSVNESCEQYNECATYQPFIDNGKPVFHVEYPKGTNTNNNDLVAASVKDSICNNSAVKGFSTIIKNILLDTFIEVC